MLQVHYGHLHATVSRVVVGLLQHRIIHYTGVKAIIYVTKRRSNTTLRLKYRATVIGPVITTFHATDPKGCVHMTASMASIIEIEQKAAKHYKFAM